MAKTIVSTAKLAKTTAPISMATKSGPLVFVAGMVSTDASGVLVGQGDIRAQTRQVLENIRHAVQAAGGKLRDITKTTVYLPDMSNYGGMNEVYAAFFPVDPPARATVRADLVKPEFLVEIEALAVVGNVAQAAAKAAKRTTRARSKSPKRSKKSGGRKH